MCACARSACSLHNIGPEEMAGLLVPRRLFAGVDAAAIKLLSLEAGAAAGRRKSHLVRGVSSLRT